MRKAYPGRSSMTIMLTIMIVLTAMTGCSRQTPVTASSTVNPAFVDVGGLRRAPVRTVSSHPMEDLRLGNPDDTGSPACIDDALYTCTRKKDGKLRMTKYHPVTGEQGWSVSMDLVPHPWLVSLSRADGNVYFAASTTAYHDTVVCMDDRSGALHWIKPLSNTTGNGISTILSAVVPVAGRDRTLATDQVCAVVSVTNPLAPTNGSGIWVWNATGILAARIVYPTLRYVVPTTTPVPLLYDGATIFAALPVTTPHDRTVITTDGKDDCTDLVAVNAATHSIHVLKSFCGRVRQLIKQDNRLIMLQEGGDGTTTIDMLAPAARAYETTEQSCAGGRRWTSIAADSTHIYAADDGGTLTSFSSVSLDKIWTTQFAPYKSRVADHVDGGELVDYYPAMTLITTRNVLYVQDGGGLVAGIDQASGTKLWEKRISRVTWHADHTDNLFLLQPVEQGFRIILADGRVSTWR